MWYRLQRDLNEDQSRAEWVHFQMFSARRTVDLKARRVEVNQGLDLDLRLENLCVNYMIVRSDSLSLLTHCRLPAEDSLRYFNMAADRKCDIVT